MQRGSFRFCCFCFCCYLSPEYWLMMALGHGRHPATAVIEIFIPTTRSSQLPLLIWIII
jgi:hypothetical protein